MTTTHRLPPFDESSFAAASTAPASSATSSFDVAAGPLPSTAAAETEATSSFRLPSSTSSASSPSSFALDPDAVLRRASSVPGCRYVPVQDSNTNIPPNSAPPPSAPPSFFPGVSVRRAAFQGKSTTTSSSGSSGSGNSGSGPSNSTQQPQPPPPPRVLSFLVTSSDGDDDPSLSLSLSSSLVRVTVFVDTGTVCASRVNGQGQVRHVFRRNVTTLDAIERLLRYPPELTPVDRTIVGWDDDDDDDEEESDNDDEADEGPVMVKDPIRVLRSELELAHVGVAILEAEKSKLEHHLQSLVEHQQVHGAAVVAGTEPGEPTLASTAALHPHSAPHATTTTTTTTTTTATTASRDVATLAAAGPLADAAVPPAPAAAPAAAAANAAKSPPPTLSKDAATTSPPTLLVPTTPSFAASKAALVAAAAEALRGSAPIPPPKASPTTAATKPHPAAAAAAAAAAPRKWDPPAPLPAAVAAGASAFHSGGASVGSASASASVSASVGSATGASASASASAMAANAGAALGVVSKDIGMEFQFSLSASSMKHVDQCMSDITGMNKLIRGVATNGRGTVFLYGNGGVAYTPSIPRPLHHKLSQLRSNTKMSSRPSYVSLGSKDRFYCAFHDGTYCVRGPKSLEKELKKCFASAASAAAVPSGSVASLSTTTTSPLLFTPVSVAFGSTWEAWFVVFGDGSWKFQGKIPVDLSNKLASRKDRGDLVRVTLGPSGEWFVKARNGRMWWGGLTDAADESVQRLLKDHELCFLDFGEDGSYFVSYD